MNAWLLTWEGTDKRISNENRIVAIISARRSSNFVEEIVDLLYHRATYSAYYMADLANKRKQRQRQSKALFSNGGRIFYGKNPCLYARQVSKLIVTPDIENKAETITWIEPAYYKQNKDNNYAIEVVEPEKPAELIRSIDRPLALDIEHA